MYSMRLIYTRSIFWVKLKCNSTTGRGVHTAEIIDVICMDRINTLCNTCVSVLEYNLKRAAVFTGKKFQSVTQTMYHINQKNDLCVHVIIITACALQQSNYLHSRLLKACSEKQHSNLATERHSNPALNTLIC